MHIFLTAGEGAEPLLDHPAVVVLQISRREIESGLTGDLVDRVMRLTDRSDRVARFANSLILSVDGYNDDPRELYEIDAVRKFFRDATEAWPFWLHFLNADEGPANQLPLLYGLLLDVVRNTSGPNGTRLDFVDPDAAMQTHARLIVALRNLHRAHAIPEDQTLERLARIQQVIGL